MRSLEDLTPEERVEEFKKTQWTLVKLQGFKYDSDEPLEEYVRMSGNIDFVVPFWFKDHGWDPDRSHVVSKEFVGIVH